MRGKTFFLLLALGGLVLGDTGMSSAADSGFKISGRLVDGANAAIAGARLVLLDVDHLNRVEISPKPDGSYEFTGLPTARYVLTPLAAGYEFSPERTPYDLQANAADQVFQGERHWRLSDVDADGEVGHPSAMTIDDLGRTHIVYYDRTHQQLKYAVGTPAHWDVQVLDAHAGYISASIAINHSNHPVVAYTGTTGLVCAEYTSHGWTHAPVDTRGHNPSLKITSAGLPVISYHNCGLKFAQFDGRSWRSQTIVPDGKDLNFAGWISSLALDALDTPSISFTDWRQDKNRLLFARRQGGQWSVETVVQGQEGSVMVNALALDSKGRPHISFTDEWNGGLCYAFLDGKGWSIQFVDKRGHWANSIQLDTADRPHISYFASAAGISDLRYAVWTGSDWTIRTVAADRVGEASSLSLDRSSRPHFSFFDSARKTLRYAELDGVATTLVSAGADDAALAEQRAFALGEVYVFPNPAKRGTPPKIHVESGVADRVTAHIYDVSGREIQQLSMVGNPEPVLSNGSPRLAYEIPWTGRIPSGVYHFVVQAEKSGLPPLQKSGSFSVVR